MNIKEALAKARKIISACGADKYSVQLADWLQELAKSRQDVHDLKELVRAQDRVMAAQYVLDERKAELDDIIRSGGDVHQAQNHVKQAKDSLCIQQARHQDARCHAQHILNDNTAHSAVYDMQARYLVSLILQPEIEHLCDTKLDELVESIRHLPPHKTQQDQAHLMSVWDKEDVTEVCVKAWFKVWQAFPELVCLVKKMRKQNEALRMDVQTSRQTIRKLTGEMAFMEFENGLIAAHMEAHSWLCEVDCFNLGQHLVRMRAAGASDELCSNAAESWYAIQDHARLEDRLAATRWACLNLCQ